MLTGTVTLGQSGPRSIGNEEALHTPQSTRTGASVSDVVYCHTQDIPFERGLALLPKIRGYYLCTQP